MADVEQNLVAGEAWCANDDCDWSTAGKNAMGTASQHANATGHTVRGELSYVFEVTP